MSLITGYWSAHYRASADAIVTGDKGMLKLKEFEGIKIISLKEYLG